VVVNVNNRGLLT